MEWVRVLATAALVFGSSVVGSTRADASPAMTVVIRNHHFVPSEIDVPAGHDVALDIRNEDAAAEEFDRGTLSFREVVFGNSSGTVRLSDVQTGRYPFFGDHSGTAQGVLVVE
jgi:hypothetical protein